MLKKCYETQPNHRLDKYHKVLGCFFFFFRACLVMAQLLEDSSFCEEFIQQCPAAVEVLNLVAQECSPGEHVALLKSSIKYLASNTIHCLKSCICDRFLLSCAGERLGMVEAQCERVRMLYRDCARPPPPPLQTDRRQVGVAKFIG